MHEKQMTHTQKCKSLENNTNYTHTKKTQICKRVTDAAFILPPPPLFLFNKSVFLGHLQAHLCLLQQGIGMHNKPKSRSSCIRVGLSASQGYGSHRHQLARICSHQLRIDQGDAVGLSPMGT